MRNNNTISKRNYIFENIFWSVVAAIWYYHLLFKCINGISYSVSKTILWGIIIASVVLGVYITWNRRRNNLSIFVNVVAPFEIYSLIAYFRHTKTLALIVLSIGTLLSMFYSYITLKRRIRYQHLKRTIIFSRIKRSLLGARTIIACCSSLLILFIGIGTIFDTNIFTPDTMAKVPTSTEEITIANNIEIVSQLNEDKWEELSSQERLNTLQTIANIEAFYLGLPHELNVKLEILPETTFAMYNDKTHIISINIDHFESDSARNILDSICHEAYHAYQHRLCDLFDNVDENHRDLLVFYDVQYYKYEFSNYIDGSDNAITYFSQHCEIDARTYARESVIDYYSKIDAYLNGKV